MEDDYIEESDSDSDDESEWTEDDALDEMRRLGWSLETFLASDPGHSLHGLFGCWPRTANMYYTLERQNIDIPVSFFVRFPCYDDSLFTLGDRRIYRLADRYM